MFPLKVSLKYKRLKTYSSIFIKFCIYGGRNTRIEQNSVPDFLNTGSLQIPVAIVHFNTSIMSLWMIDVKERFIIIFFDRSRDGRLARKILVGKSYNSPGKIHNTLEMVWSLNKNFPEISDCLLKLVMSSACSGSCLFKIKFQKFETINPLNFLVLQKVLYMVNLLSIKYIIWLSKFHQSSNNASR